MSDHTAQSDDRCTRCDAQTAPADNYCRVCGHTLRDGPDTTAIIPAEVTQPARLSQHLLPALRSDLAPLIPIVRGVATVLATAAVADWAARRMSPALLPQTKSTANSALPAPPAPRRRTVVIEERRIVRQWISVES